MLVPTTGLPFWQCSFLLSYDVPLQSGEGKHEVGLRRSPCEQQLPPAVVYLSHVFQFYLDTCFFIGALWQSWITSLGPALGVAGSQLIIPSHRLYHPLPPTTMSATAANLCCNHPRQQVDSPNPPPRPIAAIDGIFAAAALPEDHPHALRFPDRKPELNASILRSPGFASKIKFQFQRTKSKMSLGREKTYDRDAHEMTMQEALEDTEDLRSDKLEVDVGVGHPRFGSVTPGGDDEDVCRSVMKSIGYLESLIQQ